MTEVDTSLDALISDWLALPEAAGRLGLPVNRVRQLVSERQVLAVRRGPASELSVPADFIRNGRVLKGLPGTLTLLADAGYTDPEALRWLFSPDASLPGTPVHALAENRGAEVKRRAQALAF